MEAIKEAAASLGADAHKAQKASNAHIDYAAGDKQQPARAAGDATQHEQQLLRGAAEGDEKKKQHEDAAHGGTKTAGPKKRAGGVR